MQAFPREKQNRVCVSKVLSWKRGIRCVHKMLFLPRQSVPLKSTLNPTADRDSFKSQSAKFHFSQTRPDSNGLRFDGAAQKCRRESCYFKLEMEYCTRFCIRLRHKSRKGYRTWLLLLVNSVVLFQHSIMPCLNALLQQYSDIKTINNPFLSILVY